jgi:hypothetical protein
MAPSIEKAFSRYCINHLVTSIGDNQRNNQRHAFFCGFKACLTAVDQLADLLDKDEDECEKAWQILDAEFERFAQAFVSGEDTINH